MDPDQSVAATRRDLLRFGGVLAAGGLAAMAPARAARAETVAVDLRTTTTTFTGHSPAGFDQWAYVPFDVPAGVCRITVSSWHQQFVVIPGLVRNVLDLGIFGPAGWAPGTEAGFCGWSGGARVGFTISASDATPGYLPGPIEPGTWAVVLGPIVHHPSGMDWRIEVTLEAGPDAAPFEPTPAPSTAAGRGPAWYRGDMHLHTVYSDGTRTPEQLVVDARARGLDFIASTEHNTRSANQIWGRHANAALLIIPGEEVTTRHGHWLALGLPHDRWIDWRYGPAQGVFAGYAASVREVGGLVVAAHPASPGAGSTWEFGYDHVDGIEVWNGGWSIDDASAVQTWDGLLRTGRRIAAVGNSDAHNPVDTVGLPQTVVFAPDLSAPSILAAVRAGRSYLAESASVVLNLTATADGQTAGPGQSLTVGPDTEVVVFAQVSGAPGSGIALHTATGQVAYSPALGGAGTLTWRTRGPAARYVRAEVRRLLPGLGTLTTMVAMSNPVWLS